MDIEQIKELITILEESKLNKLSFKDKNGCELNLEKAPAHVMTSAPAYHAPAPSHHHESRSHQQETQAAPQPSGKHIKSPMVGTFYTTPSPQDPAFVKVGDRVEENTVVCIIEAMKVMNEVKAGVSGVIVELCVDNGHPVEFGTKLFKVQ